VPIYINRAIYVLVKKHQSQIECHIFIGEKINSENFEVNRKQQFAQVYLYIRIQENTKNSEKFFILYKN
jgi:hypothetical protein